MSITQHLGQALAYLLEGQLQAEREGQDKRMLQIRAAKRYVAKIKWDMEHQNIAERPNQCVSEQVLDSIARDSHVLQSSGLK